MLGGSLFFVGRGVSLKLERERHRERIVERGGPFRVLEPSWRSL